MIQYWFYKIQHGKKGRKYFEISWGRDEEGFLFPIAEGDRH